MLIQFKKWYIWVKNVEFHHLFVCFNLVFFVPSIFNPNFFFKFSFFLNILKWKFELNLAKIMKDTKSRGRLRHQFKNVTNYTTESFSLILPYDVTFQGNKNLFWKTLIFVTWFGYHITWYLFSYISLIYISWYFHPKCSVRLHLPNKPFQECSSSYLSVPHPYLL